MCVWGAGATHHDGEDLNFNAGQVVAKGIGEWIK
jgi:hypothetical protein